MLLVLTGRAGNLCVTATLILNSGGLLYTSPRFLGLGQCVQAVNNHNLLDLVFGNFADLKPAPADSGLVKTDTSSLTGLAGLIQLIRT
jgi:hypothetical protein